MKILELRFKNLNSLYGEWFIDFTDPAYLANGIFALTGPTGAGKSTILDAICLALYGATPRLAKITKNSNEIMSRQTGECYAEVLFESQAGQFRCHWSQHRARRRASGELQNPKHEIAEGHENGKVIEHQTRRVATVVEEKTGMDFERFTRSILLAQGGFDTFLKADLEQKSKILEQITGTGIYTEISKHVHERLRDEREKLDILRAETSGLVILEPEQEEELHQKIKEKQAEETGLIAKVSETGKAITWISGIENLRKEISSLSKEADNLKLEQESFKPEQAQLTAALKAAELDGHYAGLNSARSEQDADEKALKTEKVKLPKLESSAQQKKEALQKAEKQISKARQEQQTAAPLIQKIRALDLQLVDKKKAVEAAEADCRREDEQITSDKNIKIAEQKRRDAAKNKLIIVEEYLKTNCRDEWLVGGLAGIEEQFGNLLTVQNDILAQKNAIRKAEKTLQEAHQKLETNGRSLSASKQKLVGIQKRLELRKKELSDLLAGKLLREYRHEKENLLREQAFIRKIADLESERHKLTDGKPCPLCGALDHPFAKENIPEADATDRRILELTEIIKQAEKLEVGLKELESAEKTALKKLTDSEKIESEAAYRKENAAKYLADISMDMDKTSRRFNKLQDSTLTKLQPFGIKEFPEANILRLLDSLKLRLKNWQNHLQQKTVIEKQIATLDSELKKLAAIIETRSKTLAERRKGIGKIKNEFTDGNSKRQELFGTKSPDAAEKQLQMAIFRAELAEKQIRNAHDNVMGQLTSTQTSISQLTNRIDKRSPELNKLAEEFKNALRFAGFADEQKFVSSRLSLPERDKLKIKKKRLDNWQTDLHARQKDRANRLATEIDRKISDSKPEELKLTYKDFEDKLKNLRDILAGLKHQVLENTAAKERIKKKKSVIENQQKECTRWEKLHRLIGSVDGKKYRNFAQGLTFELMVSHANHQLDKMTDRYLLIRDKKQPLELNVVDNYQAGEVRSTKNLSGGESFVVSLTLALGLSKMASRRVRVDSLFLDEGFGTLDEETLEAALEALGGLQQDGKLIGVISHVPALKERISVQINISLISGGKSVITGPGCLQPSQ
jgi:exonuclease SbcC